MNASATTNETHLAYAPVDGEYLNDGIACPCGNDSMDMGFAAIKWGASDNAWDHIACLSCGVVYTSHNVPENDDHIITEAPDEFRSINDYDYAVFSAYGIPVGLVSPAAWVMSSDDVELVRRAAN